MTAPDRIGPPCEYCQTPQAEDHDGYGEYWSCQNPNCKGFLGYIRELERAARTRATPAPAAIRDDVADLADFLDAKHKSYMAGLGRNPADYVSGYSTARDKARAILAALRAGGDAHWGKDG